MLTHKGTQSIKTPRMVLRKFCANDAQKMYDNWAKDERVTQFLTWEPHRTVEDTQNILAAWEENYKNDNYYHWALEFKGEPVGSINIADVSDRNHFGIAGYCLGFDYWGKGLMTEALAAVIDYMFIEVGLHKVFATHDSANIGSGMVMLKAGMTREGVMREHYLRKDGRYADLQVCSILRSEWETRHSFK